MKSKRPQRKPLDWPASVPLAPETPFRDWIPEMGLGRAHRPGLNHADGPIPERVVLQWVQTLRAHGVRSVITLLSRAELAEYDHLKGGLRGSYGRHGLESRFHAVTVDAEPTLTDRQLEAIRADFLALPKPVVIHCNLGQVRSGAAVAYLMSACPVDGASEADDAPSPT